MTRAQLIDAVLAEMDRVWGNDGLQGGSEEYDWLRTHYGISEEEDVQWQLLLQYDTDDLPDEDRNDPELMEFVQDDAAASHFLATLLRKYQSSTERYPGPSPTT